MFSEITMPTSTMVPIAMAIPERATMLASTRKVFIATKVIPMARGSSPAISSELRRWRTRTATTTIVTRISSESAELSVPRVSRMRPVRS